MKYLNQREHEDIKYPTGVDDPNAAEFHAGNVKMAGCGPCSLCMVVDHLTMQDLPLEECLEISIKAGANREIGTDMKILGPVIAEKFGLKYSTTSSIDEAVECLHGGGRVIANVGGDRDDGAYIGVFSHGGHYITLIAERGGEICVLDPSLEEGKFDEPGRAGKVRLEGKFAYASRETLDRDADNREPRYYLFTR